MTAFVAGKRYAVFSIRKQRNGSSTWVRAGSAWVNKDGSVNVYLDVLPLDGVLHIREDTKGGPVKEPKDPEPRPLSRTMFDENGVPIDEEIPF